MFVFLYLGGGKVHRRIADHHVEILEGCTHKRHRWEQKPNPQTHHWAGPVCVGFPRLLPSLLLSAGIQTMFVERALR